MKRFTINEKEYRSKPITFDTVCDFEDMGIELNQLGKKQFSMVRAYFAMCSGLSKEAAGRELEQHIIHGGNFDEISVAISEEIDNSDFFRALREKAEPDATEDEETESEKK